MVLARRWWAAISLVLAACGGGGGSGGGDGGGPDPFVEPPGDVVAIGTSVSGGAGGLFVVDNTGTDTRSLADPLPNPALRVDEVLWSPTLERVAFVADPELADARHVFVVDPATGALVDLTPGAPTFATVFSVEWSDDGAFVAFIGDLDVSGRFDLYVAAAATGPAIRVNQSAAPSAPNRTVSQYRWKPGAHRLAYFGDQDVDNQFDLYFVNADGTGHLAAPRPGGSDSDTFGVEWAPTSDPTTGGHRVAFLTALAAGGLPHLFTVKDDATGLVEVVSPPAGESVNAFRWSPTAQEIAVAIGSPDFTGDSDLYVADPTVSDTSFVGPLGRHVERSFEYALGGAALVYSNRTASQADLRIRRADGSDDAIFDFPDPQFFGLLSFEISPNGTQIAYLVQDGPTRDPQNLFVIRADGTGNHQVNGPFSPPDFGYVDRYEWSPDSQRLVFSTVIYPDEPHHVFVALAAGGAPLQVSTEDGSVESVGWTSNSAFAVWTQEPAVGDDQVFLATADGLVTRNLTQDITGRPAEVDPR